MSKSPQLRGGRTSGSSHCRSGAQAGFTFLEILIVIVIVGILAALVLPSYEDGIQKAQRADGRRALSELAGLQEQYFAQNNSYTTTVAASGTGLGYGGTTSKEGFYNLTAAACSGGDISRCYTLTATATGKQADDTECASFTLDNVGRKAAFTKQGSTNTDICW